MRFPFFVVTMLACAAPSVAWADAGANEGSTPNAEPVQKPRSVPRRTAGQVVTTLGIVHLVAGAIVTGVYAYETRPGPPDSIDGGCRKCFPPFSEFIGPMLLGMGVVQSAIGIPLWISGAGSASPATKVEVGGGPGTIAVRVTF